MNTHLARVTWLTQEQGGRKSIPSGPSYSSPALIETLNDQWSVVLEIVDRPANTTDWIASIRFLVPEAPQDALTEGAKFALFEGKKCVATGELLGDASESIHTTKLVTKVTN